MTTLYTAPAPVKPAAVVVLFDSCRTRDLIPRAFGRGVFINLPATADEAREHHLSTTYSEDEFRLHATTGMPLAECRDALADFDAYCQERAFIGAINGHDDSDDAATYEEAEMAEVGIVARVVTESDFASFVPACFAAKTYHDFTQADRDAKRARLEAATADARRARERLAAESAPPRRRKVETLHTRKVEAAKARRRLTTAS